MSRQTCGAAVLLLAMAGVALPVAAATTVDFNDPLRSSQWYLDRMNFGQAWGIIYDLNHRATVRSAVLDAGFDLSHVDLTGQTSPGYNITAGEDGVWVANNHGTATLGLLAAHSGNGAGITRAALSSDILPVQITERGDGSAFATDMVKAIKYAADHGARVINLSYTGANLLLLNEAARYAKRRGAVVFMSAGNDGELHENWRNWNWIVAVGSVDRDGGVSDFSSRGQFIDFVAPGSSILTTKPDDLYSSWSGTSFSSPLAASVASLMFMANPHLNAGQVIRILRATAVDLGAKGIDQDYGYGLIDAEAAVRAALATEGKWTGEKAAGSINWIVNDLSNYTGLQLTNSLLPSVGLIEDTSAVPEPGVLALLALGGAALLHHRRRR
ncbi:MAG: S8 family serine peptidase [Phycisphaeraceae bacterium]|nr:S8 family serine peptidase [Phycisphaeraceae bacterium]